VLKLTWILLRSAAPPGDGGTGAPAAEPPPPAQAAPATPAAAPLAAGTDKPAKRWELGAIDVQGTVPKPGVMFVEAEQERLRSVMQTLVAETRAGGLADVEVSRPTELPTRAPRVLHIKARGPLKEGALLKALKPTLPTLQACRAAARPALPTDVKITAVLTLDEDGRVVSGELQQTAPTAPRVGHCVLARLKRGVFPASPVGQVKVELVVVLPPPYALPSGAADEAQPPRR
jgi:hypothetical protein